ncbi:MAG: aminopeptidase P family protein [Erysipelothrix sp.]|nr:aminopeptidase P family protein [Erysipelothrix sp.]
MSKKMKKCIEITQNKGADAALITSAHNKFYLTGFTGTTATVLVTKSKQYVMVDFRYIDQARSQCKDSIVRLIDDNYTVIDCINEIIRNEHIESIGFEEDQMTVSEHEHFSASLIAKLVGLNLSELRLIKLPEEVEIMQRAADIADEAIGYIMTVIQPGMTESEVDLLLYNKIRQLGAKSFSFNTIVASGWRGAMPHGVASSKVIEENDFVTIDFGAVYEGYCSDLTRTFAMSKQVDPKLIEIYDIVLKAQISALEACKPMAATRDIDKIARDIISDAGYGPYFQHGTGHGLGVLIHEAPRLNQLSTEVLEEGMVVTIEPGIYIPGLGGVRIEDDVLITKDGCIRLTKSDKQLKYIR